MKELRKKNELQIIQEEEEKRSLLNSYIWIDMYFLIYIYIPSLSIGSHQTLTRYIQTKLSLYYFLQQVTVVISNI